MGDRGKPNANVAWARFQSTLGTYEISLSVILILHSSSLLSKFFDLGSEIFSCNTKLNCYSESYLIDQNNPKPRDYFEQYSR